MNVLVVDDQKEVLKSLKHGVHWKEHSVDQLFLASSAAEGRLLLHNFDIDLIISDIEMPGEDGISFCRWAKEQMKDIECVLLTSHADFEYAQTAIQMDIAGYILQPVQFSEVEEMLVRIQERISRKKQVEYVLSQNRRVLGQKNTLLDAMLSTLAQGRQEEAEQAYACFRELLNIEQEHVVYLLLVQNVKYKKLTETRNDLEIRTTICNVLDELFEEEGGKAGIASQEAGEYWVFLSFEPGKVTAERMLQVMDIFRRFMATHLDSFVALYPCWTEYGFVEGYHLLKKRMQHNTEKRTGVFLEDEDEDGDGGAEDGESAVQQALEYVKKNLKRNITRTEVAEHVYLNEEYFSRLFKKETGVGFKEYVQSEKMKEAQKLLANSKLSVEIIASKVGYTNFSYFSAAFRKIVGVSPQEYRKSQNKQ